MMEETDGLRLEQPEQVCDRPRQCSFDHLAPQDVSVLVAHFCLPTPTPDVTIGALFARASMTAEDVWQALEGTTSIKLMIAAAAVRGLTRALPSDPLLHPLPLPPLPRSRPVPGAHASYASPASGAAEPAPPLTDAPDPEAVVLSVALSPMKAGSLRAERYAHWVVGDTVAQCAARGLRSKDIRAHVERGWVKLGGKA